MGPKAKSGPGRAQRKGTSESSTTKASTTKASTTKATTTRTGRVGRYTPPEQSGKYTRPIPKNVRHSARWFGPAILFLMLFGILMILLNYLTVLPGSVSIWYLVGGLATILAAFMMATRYR